MTENEFRLKYRRSLLGLAGYMVIDHPAVTLSPREVAEIANVRGKRLEDLESLGREIDRVLRLMYKDLAPEPVKNGQPVK